MPAYRSLYIEENALAWPHGQELVRRFDGSPIVVIGSYNEVFARPRQEFQLQKRAPSLVAAVGRPPYLYEAPGRVCGVHHLPVYYNAQLRNCVYNCDYCFLQGMHSSGHTLVYVNGDDFERAAAEQAENGPYWLSVSYLTDILAFEETLPLVSHWLEFARATPDVTLEVRTKGEGAPIVRQEPLANVVLIWTLSPHAIAARYERGCASLRNRLVAAGQAIDRGWRVRLAFDPVVLVPEWEAAYRDLVAEVFHRLPADRVEAATYGVFRVGADHMSRMATRADSDILHHPFRREGGVVTYHPHEIDAVHRVVGTALKERLPDDRVQFVAG